MKVIFAWLSFSSFTSSFQITPTQAHGTHQYSLSYFLVNLLQSKRFKISPTSTLDLSRRFLFLRLMINLWHLYQVRHRERSSGLIVYIQNNCSDQNNVLNKKFIIAKIVIKNFRTIYESSYLCSSIKFGRWNMCVKRLDYSFTGSNFWIIFFV